MNKSNKYSRLKKPKKKYAITGEILPDGTLKRNPTCFVRPTQTPVERWAEIIDICADIIAESGLI